MELNDDLDRFLRSSFVNSSEGKIVSKIWDGKTVLDGFLKKYRRIDHRNARFSWQLYLTVRPLIPRDQWNGVNAVHTSLYPRTRIARIFLAGFEKKKKLKNSLSVTYGFEDRIL